MPYCPRLVIDLDVVAIDIAHVSIVEWPHDTDLGVILSSARDRFVSDLVVELAITADVTCCISQVWYGEMLAGCKS